jgi:hypothetical protein
MDEIVAATLSVVQKSAKAFEIHSGRSCHRLTFACWLVAGCVALILYSLAVIFARPSTGPIILLVIMFGMVTVDRCWTSWRLCRTALDFVRKAEIDKCKVSAQNDGLKPALVAPFVVLGMVIFFAAIDEVLGERFSFLPFVAPLFAWWFIASVGRFFASCASFPEKAEI